MKKSSLKTINNITRQDYKELSINELRKLNREMVKDIEKHYDTWTTYLNKHKNTPLPQAYIDYREGKGNIEDILDRTKLKNIIDYTDNRRKRDVYDTFTKLRDFVNTKSYTITGQKEIIRRFKDRIDYYLNDGDDSEDRIRFKYTRKFADIYWEAYNKITGHGDETERTISQVDLAKAFNTSQYDSNNFQMNLYNVYEKNKSKIKSGQDLVDIIQEMIEGKVKELSSTSTSSRFLR